MDYPYQTIELKARELGLGPTSQALFVSISKQKLYHYRFGELIRTYTVSTSRNAPSCIENSLGTPTGLHRVARKIGHEAPIGMVFKGRLPVGKPYWELPLEEQEGKNLITTRILWLEGLEPGINSGPGVDTFERYIYIHGTNHENRIGSPLSAGCVLLRNHDIRELFEQLPAFSHVLISLDEE